MVSGHCTKGCARFGTVKDGKLTKIFENEGVTEKENQSNILRNGKDWLFLYRNI